MTMIALSSSRRTKRKCTLNILPCKVNHTGTINASQRLWSASTDDGGKLTAYFRGRRLRGRRVRVPQGYRGAVLVKSPSQKNNTAHSPISGPMDSEEDEDEPENEIEMYDEMASFDEVIPWGHEVLPNETDPFVKGLEEWVSFAERMHSFPEQEHMPCPNTSKA